MADFLLVHGAFQGGWIWRDLAAALRALGHQAHTPTLTGCGYLQHGLRKGIDLHTYIQDLTGYVHMEELSDVVLVGHSYSGMVCGALIQRLPHSLQRAVFVDAVIPQPGRSFADIAGEAFRAMLEAHRAPNGGAWKVRPWPSKVFGVPDDPASREAWFRARLCDFPLDAFLTPFPGEFEPDAVETSYISCRNTPSPFIRAMADTARGLGWPVQELDSSHSPMTTHPRELAQVLDELLAGVATEAS